jgi:hypothetical protein
MIIARNWDNIDVSLQWDVVSKQDENASWDKMSQQDKMHQLNEVSQLMRTINVLSQQDEL